MADRKNRTRQDVGSYVLLIEVTSDLAISVGSLGCCLFPAGMLAYVGSALGPGGLRARVGRHLRQQKKCHWHIDYLTLRQPIMEVWCFRSPARLECNIGSTLAQLASAERFIAGFGATDCRCNSHLVHLSCKPEPMKVAGIMPEVIRTNRSDLW